MLKRICSARGVSTTDMAAVLTAMTLLTSAAAPSIDGYVLLAQQVRAQHDVRTLAVSILRLRVDVASEITIPAGLGTYTLLVGDGKAPQVPLDGDREWTLPPGARGVGHLADHLVGNGPDYRMAALGSTHGWRGPYLDAPAIKPDPWGHRYAINARWLGHGRRSAVVVLSAGPNGIVETSFDTDVSGETGDDVFALVAGAR